MTTCSRSRSRSLFLDSLSLIFGAPNFRVIGDLLKNFWTITPGVHEPPLPTFRPPTQQTKEKARVIIHPSRPDKTRIHYSGTHYPLGWESGKEDRMHQQRSKQEKARSTSLESQQGVSHCRRERETSGPLKRRLAYL